MPAGRPNARHSMPIEEERGLMGGNIVSPHAASGSGGA